MEKLFQLRNSFSVFYLAFEKTENSNTLKSLKKYFDFVILFTFG